MAPSKRRNARDPNIAASITAVVLSSGSAATVVVGSIITAETSKDKCTSKQSYKQRFGTAFILAFLLLKGDTADDGFLFHTISVK